MSDLQPRRDPTTVAVRRFGVLAALLAVLWVLELADQVSGNALDSYGIEPRTDEGLWHVFTAPLLHFGWGHLVSNSIPFLVLGFLVLLGGWRQWWVATLASVLVSGAFVWLLAPVGSTTLGASGVVFGWLTYLLVRGFFSRDGVQILVAVGVFLLYGGVLLGVLPGTPGMSWQGHLGGAVGGALAAWALHRRRVPDHMAIR